VIFPSGTLKKLYIDREDVKTRQEAAKPWVVEVQQAGIALKFRGTAALFLFAHGLFDLKQRPPIWVETYETVELTDGEPFL